MRVTKEKRAEQLAALVRYLSEFRTAAQIAKRFQCTKFAAYDRVKALEADGYSLATIQIPKKGRTGPSPTAWRVYAVR